MPTLTARQIAIHLKQIPHWARHGTTITRTYPLESFQLSIAFVERIAIRAEKMQHHPDIDIRYDEVTLTLTTHDDGGLTKNDFTLAAQADEDFVKFSEE
jgi:4a-hydroxytetrahydrobiopterin dehydratase